MCHAEALITVVRGDRIPDSWATPTEYDFRLLTKRLEDVFVASGGTVREACALFPENGKVFKVYLLPVREPSTLSYTCAAIYVRNRYNEDKTNFTTYWNTQVVKGDDNAFMGTMCAAFKLCRDHKRVTWIK